MCGCRLHYNKGVLAIFLVSVRLSFTQLYLLTNNE